MSEEKLMEVNRASTGSMAFRSVGQSRAEQHTSASMYNNIFVCII